MRRFNPETYFWFRACGTAALGCEGHGWFPQPKAAVPQTLKGGAHAYDPFAFAGGLAHQWAPDVDHINLNNAGLTTIITPLKLRKYDVKGWYCWAAMTWSARVANEFGSA